jgi:hypothetical protein
MIVHFLGCRTMQFLLNLISAHVKHEAHAMELIRALVKYLTPDNVRDIGELVRPIMSAKCQVEEKIVEATAVQVAAKVQTLGTEFETAVKETEPTVSNDASTVASSQTLDSATTVSEPAVESATELAPAAPVAKWSPKSKK